MAKSQELINRILEVVPADRVLIDEPLANYTSFRIGGPADALVLVDNEEELASVLKIVKASEHILIGNGSNFLVADDGYPGIMIKLQGEFDGAEVCAEGATVRAGGAMLLSNLSAYLTQEGLSGFEFASGIPGSVGGAIFMNAGAYGMEMKDIVKSVRLLKPDGSAIIEKSSEQMDFSYRHSAIQESGEIVLSVEFKFEKDNKDIIKDRVRELQEKRNAKQPVNFPSAGSTFKRPASGYAAALIDEAGLRGCSVGAAQVSEKHAGFIINTGGATANDVLELMRHVRKVVYEKSGIMLEPEIRLINCKL